MIQSITVGGFVKLDSIKLTENINPHFLVG
jgi:hypothetical protein